VTAQAERTLLRIADHFTGLRETLAEKVFLSEMHRVNTRLQGDSRMIIYNEPYPGPLGNSLNAFHSPPDPGLARCFGAHLNYIRTSVTKSAGNLFRLSTAQVCRIDEGVELTGGETPCHRTRIVTKTSACTEQMILLRPLWHYRSSASSR
jgi:hypothetical protein